MRDYEIIREDPDRRILSIMVGASSRFFTGHFPDRPVLPAIAQLTLVDRLLRCSFGEHAHIVAIESLRLAKPVLPNHELDVRLVPIENDSTQSARFTIHHGDELISEGLVTWSRDRP